MPAHLLALALSLLRPSAEHPRAQIEAMASARIAAIVQATDDPLERTMLTVIDAFETGHGIGGGVPYGATSMRGWSTHSLVQIAAWSARVLRSADRACYARPLSISVRLGFYHSGRCVADAWSRREAAVIERVR